MRKINWKDPDLFLYAVRCLTAAWNVRYNSIHCLANLVSGLALYYVIDRNWEKLTLERFSNFD